MMSETLWLAACILAAVGLCRWIAYLVAIRREQDERPGRWPKSQTGG